MEQIGTAAGDQEMIGVAIRSLGSIQFEQHDLAAARKSYEQALTIFEKINATAFLQDANMALASIDLEEGRQSDTERESRTALEEFRKAKNVDAQANAGILLARAMLAQHKIEDAQSIAADALRVTSTGSRANQIAAATAMAETQTAAGKAADAENRLKQLVNDAHKASLVPVEFDARLALAEAEVKAGKSSAGRAQFASLEQDSRTKGFLLVAHKAAAAAKLATRD